MSYAHGEKSVLFNYSSGSHAGTNNTKTKEESLELFVLRAVNDELLKMPKSLPLRCLCSGGDTDV